MLTNFANQFVTFLRNIDFGTRMFCMVAFILVAMFCVIKFVGKNVEKTKISWLHVSIALLLITACILLAVYQ